MCKFSYLVLNLAFYFKYCDWEIIQIDQLEFILESIGYFLQEKG